MSRLELPGPCDQDKKPSCHSHAALKCSSKCAKICHLIDPLLVWLDLGMPKVKPDPELQRRVRAVVAACGGNLSIAAKRLRVDRHQLGRFCSTGGAIGRNKQRLLEGLASVENAQQNAQRGPFDPHQWFPSEEDLISARRVFGSMIQLIDAFLMQAGQGPARKHTGKTGHDEK